MYISTKEYVTTTVTPAVQSACAVVQPAMKTAYTVVEPAVQAAKHVVEPAVQSARQIAEPLMQPALDKAYALKEYGTQKVEEFLHRHHESGINFKNAFKFMSIYSRIVINRSYKSWPRVF